MCSSAGEQKKIINVVPIPVTGGGAQLQDDIINFIRLSRYCEALRPDQISYVKSWQARARFITLVKRG